MMRFPLAPYHYKPRTKAHNIITRLLKYRLYTNRMSIRVNGRKRFDCWLLSLLTSLEERTIYGSTICLERENIGWFRTSPFATGTDAMSCHCRYT
jgi:hypothetical protein